MTIVLPKNYHATQALQERRILCISDEEAVREDIRPLRIGIMNIMPQAETYEFSLLYPLGRSVIQIEPVWIRLETHQYLSTDAAHLDTLYVTFKQAVDNRHLDGLILTGAPVEEIPFEQVNYWEEVQEILKYSRAQIASTLGICWGALALARFMGMDKDLMRQKMFGVFETRNIYPEHRITGEMDDIFWCPQSRHSWIPDNRLEEARDQGKINLLAHGKDAGYTIFESADQRFLMHLGHPEYESTRLVEEYYRDMKKGRTDVAPPQNVDLGRPVNRWRSHCLEFFAQWIKFIHEETPF